MCTSYHSIISLVLLWQDRILADDGSRPLWQEPADSKAWVHDKFSEITSEEYDPAQHQPSSFGGRKSGRGRGGKSSRGGRRRNGGRAGRRNNKAPNEDTHDRRPQPASTAAEGKPPAAVIAPAEVPGDQAPAALSETTESARIPATASPKWGDADYKGDGVSELASPAPAPVAKRKKATIVDVARVTTKAGTRGASNHKTTKSSKAEVKPSGRTEKAAARQSRNAGPTAAPEHGTARKTDSGDGVRGRGKPGRTAGGRPAAATSASGSSLAAGKVVRYSTQRKASGKSASTFVPSPSAVAAAYQQRKCPNLS